MQKLIVFLLSILLVFSLCGCENFITDTFFSGGSSTHATLMETIQTQNEPENKETVNKVEDTSGGNTTKEPEKNEPEVPAETPSEPPLTPPVSEPEIPDINEIVANHSALPKEQYYQYSFLNDTEKAVYNEICLAAEKCQNIVDLTKYNLDVAVVKKIYEAFTADCPQYFYISKHCVYIVDSSAQTVAQFLLRYTDGTVIDKFDDNNKPIILADRQKINNQIIEFANKINAILSYIPSDISELERERRIYEYITDTVTYDEEAVPAFERDPDYLSYSFSAYGAACKGTAVCEGYVKLFQYLCYNSGINVTPVESDKDMQHMWAAVNIDDNWYMADITWDDTDNALICAYEYFNVTTLYLSADHSFGSNLMVPPCDSEEASFYNNFALIPKHDISLDTYKKIIKVAITNSDKYLYIYRGASSADFNDFINEEIYYGELGEYIKSLGYTLGDEYYHSDNYYFIPISNVLDDTKKDV